MLVGLNEEIHVLSFEILVSNIQNTQEHLGEGVKTSQWKKNCTHTENAIQIFQSQSHFLYCTWKGVYVCNVCFSSFDHADQMHAFIRWNHHQPPTCCIAFSNFFFIEQMLSCKFLQGQRGQVPPGFHSWHRIWDQKPLKFRVSSLNTDAGPDDPVVFQSSLWALTRAWPSAG